MPPPNDPEAASTFPRLLIWLWMSLRHPLARVRDLARKAPPSGHGTPPRPAASHLRGHSQGPRQGVRGRRSLLADDDSTRPNHSPSSVRAALLGES